MLINELIAAYRTDTASPYHKQRYHSRKHSDTLCKTVAATIGGRDVAELRTREVLLTYDQWKLRGVSMSHALMTQLRTLVGFGATILEDTACAHLSVRLHGLRFEAGKPRSTIITAAQVVAIRRTAHAMGLHSIAIAQAFQFECALRQKDVIGEWIPEEEAGPRYLVKNGLQWWRGLKWEEIDSRRVLRHVTSKRQKEIVANLMLAPMVMEELGNAYHEWPRTGPVVVCELTGVPWRGDSWRLEWRRIARKAGVPDDVYNMDTRSGAITEALAAGAQLDAVRKMATHSDASMTQRYSRDDQAATAEVMRLRALVRGD